jgi:hypothetical protein
MLSARVPVLLTAQHISTEACLLSQRSHRHVTSSSSLTSHFCCYIFLLSDAVGDSSSDSSACCSSTTSSAAASISCSSSDVVEGQEEVLPMANCTCLQLKLQQPCGSKAAITAYISAFNKQSQVLDSLQ